MITKEKLNKDYLKKVDNTIEMIPLTFDAVFKGVFERNLDILKHFLIHTLDLKLDIETTKIEILNNELIKENIKEYQKKIDILVLLDNRIYIDIEINRSSFEKVKARNMLYCDKLYSMLLEKGKHVDELKNITLYQLNLNTEDSSITYGENIIVAYSLTHKNIFIDNKFIVLKYLEFYRNLYYTSDKDLGIGEIWLAALTADNFTKLDSILTNILPNKSKNKFIKEAIRMSKLEFNLHEWEKEKMDELVRLESKRIDKEEGFKEGIEQGIENEKNIIKNMLKKNMDLETISQITEKSIEEIKEIQKNI